MKQKFDINCLKGLKVEEIESLLKSNTISKEIRKQITKYKDELEYKEAYNFVSDKLPMIISTGISLALIGEVSKEIERICKQLKKEGV